MAKNEAWGIDVGANAIKAIKLARSSSGVRVQEFEVLPFKHVLTTPDLNVDEAIQVQLDSLIQKHDMSKDTVVTAVAGNMAFARFAKLPPVEPKKIPDIVRFEAQQQIPFPIEQVEWDYQVFQQDDSPDVEVGIFAITKERVMQFLSNFRAIDLKIDSLTLSPLAVYNAFRYDAQEDDGVIYMDIGTTSTDVVIVEQGGIWLRTLPIGGNNFTEALVKQFKISFPKAEKLKREAATSKYAKQIFQAMRAVFADLVQEVQRSLGFYQSLNRDSNLTKLVGVGSTFRLPGLQKFLKQQLQLQVVRPDSFERLSVDGKREAEFSNHALNMATAYGLALQGLGLEAVSANILPSHVLASRMWRAKQPWIAASAACFVVAAGLVGAKYFIDSGKVNASLASINSQVRPVLSEAKNQASEWQTLQQNEDPRQFIENIRRVLDHRNVWSGLIEDISQATLALDPQASMLGADYDAITAIPRTDRKRVYIDSITARYEAEPVNGKTLPTDLAQMASSPLGLDTFFSKDKGPRFIITVKGTTPMRDAATALSNKLIRWVRDNADRPDRPYVFKFTENKDPVRTLNQVGTTGTTGSGVGSGGQQNPAAAFGGGFGGFGGGGFGAPGKISGSAAQGGNTIADLLPKRPFAEEARENDWEFALEWIVELRAPIDARPRVDRTPSRPAPPPEPEDTAPDAGPAAEGPAVDGDQASPLMADGSSATEVNQ